MAESDSERTSTANANGECPDEYEKTPSFYNSDEVFEKYLGQTSYYLGLQNNLVELATYIDPDRIVEFGSGTGKTTLRLAKELPETEIQGIDNREGIVDTSEENRERLSLSNAAFQTADMIEYVADADVLPELVVMLYSFHHIPDPLQQKVEFLEDSYAALADGGYICVAETFLQSEREDEQAIQGQWDKRSREGYASTFWSALEGLDGDEIEYAREAGDFSQDHEQQAGENVRTRDDEYLIQMDWLTENARDVGFEVVIAEPVNAVGDGIVLLQK